MASGASTEKKLARLAEIEAQAMSEEAVKEIRQSLRSRNGLVTAKAAHIVNSHVLGALTPDLVSAFEYCLEAPSKDKGCLAKLAIVEALNALEYGDAGVFLRGVRHVQMEPVWGKRIDTAGALRGCCVPRRPSNLSRC